MNQLLVLSLDCLFEFAKGSRAFDALCHQQLFGLLGCLENGLHQTKSHQLKQTIATDHAMFNVQLGVSPR